MAFKVLTGPLLNNLERAFAGNVTMTPSAAAIHGVEHAYDNRASKAALFGSAVEDSVYTVDGNLLSGDFETDEAAATWAVLGVGTIASDAGLANTGTKSALVTPFGTAPRVIVYRDVWVRPGEELNFFGAACIVAGTHAIIRIRNRQTGKWLSNALAWEAAQQDLFTSTNVAFETTDLDPFTVEALSVCQDDLVQLRVYLEGTAGTARFDSIELFPSVNWASVHGHNIPPAIVPTLQQSDDGSSWTTETVMTLRRNSFHAMLSSLQQHRYWRLLLDGRPGEGELMYVGELITGQSVDFLRNPRYGGSLTFLEKQTRFSSDLGEDFVHQHNVKAGLRRLLLPMRFQVDAEYEQYRDVIFGASRGGVNTIVIAPTEMDSSVVILGRVRESIEVPKDGPYPRAGELEIVELPLPNVPDIVGAYDAPVEEGV